MEILKKLAQTVYTAVLSDVLDSLGYDKQVMRPFVRPLDETLVCVGRARTGMYMSTYSVGPNDNPYETEIRLLDDLQPGEVPVLACNGPTESIVPWGELLTTAAMSRKAAGCVTDGLVRDVKSIRSMGFPVFSGGIRPLDSRARGRMVEIDTVIECGGVRVCTGDIIFGDVDGVLVIPLAIADDVLRLAEKKVTSENHTREALRSGALLSHVYQKYGVL